MLVRHLIGLKETKSPKDFPRYYKVNLTVLLGWMKCHKSITKENQTPETFKSAINMMKISIRGGTLAINHILQFIQTNNCKKPQKPTVE
jgi:hypothetical protein